MTTVSRPQGSERTGRFGNAFGFLQTIGKALMLPVAVLPVAGLLLGIGAAGFSWMPEIVSDLMRSAGEVVFGNMALLFAIAVALGFTKNDGVSAVAATIGYAVMLATMGVMAVQWGQAPVDIMGIPSIQTGIFGGILAGGLAAWMFNRFYRIELPPYLGFFAGKRFVPIVTALAAIGLGVILSLVWPPIQGGINAFSHWAAVGDPRLAATTYGFVERLLIPFGLHHIWNAPFFYEIGSYVDPVTGRVVTGDIQRFFSGDPTAGILGGAYLFKMFGLPAAAIAIWHSAKPQNKVAVGGMMLSGALTSFLTGITEPIEFAFLFVAPQLYLLHAVLAATAQFVFAGLDVHMGFTFSQGGIDFVLFNVLSPFSQRWWLVLVLGPVWAGIYYVAFRAGIRWLDLKTPGREAEATVAAKGGAGPPDRAQRGRDLVMAFGGPENLVDLDACITRLRITVNDTRRVDRDRLAALGASGTVVVGRGVQAIFGPASDGLKNDMQAWLDEAGLQPVAGSEEPAPAESSAAPEAGPPAPTDADAATAAALVAALGGRANVAHPEVLALTRIRVELEDPTKMDEAAVREAGVLGLVETSPGAFHLIVGPRAEALAAALRTTLDVTKAA